MVRRMPRVGAAVLVVVAMAVSGCSVKGAQDFTLPGGVATGDDAYEVTVELSDVLDLVPQSAVKLNDVTVGSVSDIDLDDDGGEVFAVVTIRVRDDVELPSNTRASLRQTSLLGEKFISLDPPAEQQRSSTALRDMTPSPRIALRDTTRNVEIEELLGALSLVLNGGGLEQLQTISREVTATLAGREDEIKDLLDQLTTFIGGLDDQKADIVRALESLDRLTQRLAGQRTVLATALEDLPEGARILADQRENLVALVTGLERLGQVGVRVIEASQQNTVASLQALQPILTSLNAAGESLPNALSLLVTYPFPETITSGIRGDYANLYVTLDLSSVLVNPLPGLPGPLGDLPLPDPPPLVPSEGAPNAGAPAAGGAPPAEPVLPPVAVPSVPGLTGEPVDPAMTSLTDLLLGGLIRAGGAR